jgi:hypothetical protein
LPVHECRAKAVLRSVVYLLMSQRIDLTY